MTLVRFPGIFDAMGNEFVAGKVIDVFVAVHQFLGGNPENSFRVAVGGNHMAGIGAPGGVEGESAKR